MVVAEDGEVGAHRRQRDMFKRRVAAQIKVALQNKARAALGSIIPAAVYACDRDRLCMQRLRERLAYGTRTANNHGAAARQRRIGIGKRTARKCGRRAVAVPAVLQIIDCISRRCRGAERHGKHKRRRRGKKQFGKFLFHYQCLSYLFWLNILLMASILLTAVL